MSLHSPYGPSTLDKTAVCTAFRTMVEGLVDEETEEQKEGTAAHWVGSEMLMERSMKYNPSLKEPELNDYHYVGKTAPNGVIITEEMFDAALCYFQAVMKVAGKGHIQSLHVEEPVMIPQIHAACFGTPDCWLFIPEKLELHVWDFKYGHRAVKVEGNYQLRAYDVGVLNRPDVAGDNALQDIGVTVHNHIVQPRNYYSGQLTTESFNSVDLRATVNVLNMACAEADNPDQRKCVTGPHCIGCAARFKCKALTMSGALIVDYATSAMPVDITNEGIEYELQLLERATDLLKQRKEAMTQLAQSKLRSGERLGGYGLEQGYSTRKWNMSNKEIIAMGKLIGVDLEKKDEVLTPFQAEQSVKRMGKPVEVLDGISGKQPTAMKLVYDDGSKAKQIFSQEKI